jgi:hypothetical protein
MRPLFAALFVLAATVGIVRADEPKHNPLTPKEIADGWLLLFDSETTFGWEEVGGAAWRVAEGMLAAPVDKVGTLVHRTPFREFELRLEYLANAASKAEVIIGDKGKDNPTIHTLPPATVRWGDLRVRTSATGNGHFIDVTTQTFGSTSRQFYRSNSAVPTLRLALSGTKVVFRNIRIRPLGTQPLFNRSDLVGWKKYTADGKRIKTDFSVTKEGFLHLKNGPGDLQTEARYDDFVLQVECRTNGKNLNSGVFFRCIPGDYQNGYEAQIHNGFLEKPKEYVVEEYDPKTNELKDKIKVKSPAQDYGTGAIYRRVPARRQASHDGEWFTMTVVAQGRHIATWVNGIQMVDWTDNRPLNDNPRNGCRLEKGAISLQGHDPTTDIDFRSIRLAEFPRSAK